MEQQDTLQFDGKVKMRLPNIGCFGVAVITFFLVFVIVATFYNALFKSGTKVTVPSEEETLYAPVGLLLDEDAKKLRSIADEIEQTAQCEVAVIFQKFSQTDHYNVMRTICSEWDVKKGVLLLAGVNNNVISLRLVGDGWHLTRWNPDKVRPFINGMFPAHRGEAAIRLLTRFKESCTPTADELASIPSNAKPEDATIYSGANVSSETSVTSLCLIFIFQAIAVSGIFLLYGVYGKKWTRRNNEKVKQSFEERSQNNKKLKLICIDDSKPKTGFFMNRKLRIAAFVIGCTFGLFLTLSAILDNDKITRDKPVKAEKLTSQELGQMTSRVMDIAGVFSPEETEKLLKTIKEVETSTGGEVVVLTIMSLNGQNLEQFSYDTASRWAIGKAGKDNGALLTLVINDRKNRLEIGYGWEGVINDAKAGRLLRSVRPKLQAMKYAEACEDIVRGIGEYVTGTSDDISELASRPTAKTYAVLDADKKWTDVRKSMSFAERAMILLALLFVLCEIVLCYYGRLLAKSIPSLYIDDPDAVRRSSSSSSERSSRSHSSSSSYGGGGGSFGGGGASSNW